MKKMLVMGIAGAMALALVRALISRRADHDVWAEFADEV